MGMWLIEESTLRELRAMRAAHPAIDSKDLLAFGEAVKAARDQGPRSLSVADDVAEIAIEGVLTETRDIWLWIFGVPNAAWDDIRSAIATAERDPTIKRVVFKVNSPGGEVAGMFETLAAMQGMQKPKSTTASLAASAAYGVAAQGGKVTAVSHAARFGSVGVVATYLVEDDLVDVTSTEAPDKRPDPSTDEGKAVIRAHLDEIHQLFAEHIAAGRGTTVEKVNAEFGRGGMMLANAAKGARMIDKILGARPLDAQRASADVTTKAEEPPAPMVTEAKPSATDEGVAQKAGTMDLKKLKAEHPDVFDAAVKETLEIERDRVNAHLIAGEASGDMKTALESVRSGAVMTSSLQTKYMMATANRRDARNSDEDDAAAAAAANNVNTKPGAEETKKSFADQVYERMNARKGKV